MSDLPELEEFLEDKTDDGAILGEGEFTVHRGDALRKLAQHSLPFAGAWLLKAVQTAVAAGCERGIVVTSTRTETIVRFDSARPWNHEEVWHAFLDPDPEADEVLGHLKYALWGAGISGLHPFTLRLPQATHDLVWSGGETLVAVPATEPSDNVLLTVSHSVLGQDDPGFFEARRQARKINAETLGSLGNNAYTCPVPLTLDGRRLDSLFLAPVYFHGAIGQPVELGFLDREGCPPWYIPLGTFDALRKRQYNYKVDSIDRLALEAAEEAPQVGSASIAYVYVAHLDCTTVNKTVTWRTATSKSNLYWVKDGVLVRQETWPMEPTALSFNCYVSAAGLSTDLTTLKLIQSDEKAERTSQVIKAMSHDIARPREFGLDEVVAGARRSDRVGGTVTGLMGLLLLPALPVGLLFLWLSKGLLSHPGGQVEALVKEVEQSYPVLQESWKKVNADHLPTAEEYL